MIKLVGSAYNVTAGNHRFYNREVYVLLSLNILGQEFLIYSEDCNDAQGRYGGALKIDTSNDLGIYPAGTDLTMPSSHDLEFMIQNKINLNLEVMVQQKVDYVSNIIRDDIMNRIAEGLISSMNVEEMIKSRVDSVIAGRVTKEVSEVFEGAKPVIISDVAGSMATTMLGHIQKFTEKQQEQFCVELANL